MMAAYTLSQFMARLNLIGRQLGRILWVFSSLFLPRPLLRMETKCLPIESMMLTRKQVAFNSLSMELKEANSI